LQILNTLEKEMTDQTLQIQCFNDIDIGDDFFDSLKNDYREFTEWFLKKADNQAFVFRSSEGSIEGFLYLKIEDGCVIDVSPQLPTAKRLKLGTFKINPHGTRLGERFMKRAFDIAIAKGVNGLYVTVFEKHTALIRLFEKYGFEPTGHKHSTNGTEIVYERRLDSIKGDVVLDYPRIPLCKDRCFVLSIYPEWHSRLLPDSLLANESASILQDVSHTNSIHKIYLTAMSGVSALKRGDILLIYRTQSNGSAYYTSVITSVCVVEEVTHIDRFHSVEEFKNYCRPYSVFTDSELARFFLKRSYPWAIRFTYNLALSKRINRKSLIENVGLSPSLYWGFFQISSGEFKQIVKLSGDYEKTRSLVYSS
jgi:GNAT superfamily N-acetyltransferase